jgi:hypothetical protein
VDVVPDPDKIRCPDAAAVSAEAADREQCAEHVRARVHRGSTIRRAA